MENTTSEMDPTDHRSVAEHLILQTEPQQEAPPKETSDEEVVVEEEQVEAQAETDADEEHDEEEATIEAEPDDLVTVKVDGEERQVTPDELKRGYSGQAYIQKQLSELAEQRKSMQTQFEQAQNMEQRYAEAIQQYAQKLTTSEPQMPERSMRDTDPIGYLEAMDDYRLAMSERQQLQQEQSALAQRQEQEKIQQQNQYVQDQTHIVLERIPELKDPEKAPKAIERMMDEGRKRGFSEAELKAESDPRMVEALHDLAKLRAQGNFTTKKEVKRGAIKPGAKRSAVSQSAKKVDAARQAMKSSGSTQDAARWIMTR